MAFVPARLPGPAFPRRSPLLRSPLSSAPQRWQGQGTGVHRWLPAGRSAPGGCRRGGERCRSGGDGFGLPCEGLQGARFGDGNQHSELSLAPRAAGLANGQAEAFA